MPRRRAEDVERWNHVVQKLMDAVVREIVARDHERATAEDVSDDEIRAWGVVALRALNDRQNGTRARAPSQWNWGKRRWIIPVRQELPRRRLERDAAAFLAQLPRRGSPAAAPTPPTRRFDDDERPDHPGWELFKGVFSDDDVARWLELKKRVHKKEWAHLFNTVEWEPSACDEKRIRAALGSRKGNDAYERVVMPRKRSGWSVTVGTSAFRQQAHVGTDEDEEWLMKRLEPLLPERAVFPPTGQVAYMIQNVQSAPKTASRSEQPMHYDFEPGLQRLSVIVSLHDSCYLAVGDRWSDDVTKVSKRVRVPKGSVLVFSNSVPHAGMGDVVEDFVERLHVYVGIDCAREDVHPVGEEDGELLTFFASQEHASRMNIGRKSTRGRAA